MFLIAKVPALKEPAIFFFMDHIAIMGLFIFIAYYLHILNNKLTSKKISK